MSPVSFLLDEHVPPLIQARPAQMAPELQVYVIGEAMTPERGTPDPDVLIWIAAHGCMLVTNNRASMPGISPSIWLLDTTSLASFSFPGA